MCVSKRASTDSKVRSSPLRLLPPTLEFNTEGPAAPFVPRTMEDGKHTDGRSRHLLAGETQRQARCRSPIPRDDLIKIIDNVLSIVDEGMFKDKMASCSLRREQ